MTEEKQQLVEDEQNEEPRQKRKWGQIAAWVGIIFLLGIVAIQLVKPQKLIVGDPAPDFTFYTFEDEAIPLEELRGKVVVLNIWASWCVECGVEAPDVQAAWEYYEERGDVIFLGVAWTDTDSAAEEYVNKYDITYTNGPDRGTRISQAYRVTGVPETFIIDKEGNLVYVKIGPFMSRQEIFSAVDAALSQ